MDWWHWKRAEHALDTWVRALIGARPYTIRFATGKGSFVNFSTREIVIEPNMPDSLGGERLLPRPWRRQRVRELPGLQWRCARTLARHEAAHVLFTQVSKNDRGGAHHWLINALEDGRIERYLGAMAPWAWADFLELGMLVWQQYTLPDGRAERLLSACLLHRWDVLRPKKTASRIAFPQAADCALWEERIRPLVERAWLVSDTEDVAAIASEILKLIGLAETASAPRGLSNPIDSGTAGERAADDQPLSVAGTSADSRTTADDPPIGEDSVEGADPPGVDVDLTRGNLLLHPYREIEHEVAGEVRRLITALAPPTPNTAPRAHMVKGRFSAREHVRSKGEKPMLLGRERAPDPGGLALVLLIDRTGSMGNYQIAGGVPGEGFYSPGGRMYHARRAAMLLDRASASAHIPLCIGFAGNEVSPRHGPYAGRTLHLPQSVVWIRDWATPAGAEGPLAAIAGMYGDAGNAERISESLRLAREQLRERREPTRVIVYIHDGQPTDETPQAVAKTVAAVRRDGIIVLGLFVGDQRELPKLAAIFGPDDTIGVVDLAKLPERLGAILKRYYR